MKDDHAPDAKPETPKPPVVVKKYANRRLYNTESSSYVTLDDLAAMVRAGRDFVVSDARTGDDLTRAVLTQIIVEQEARRDTTLLPVGFLRQLIRFYGNQMEALVPAYLEHSLDSLANAGPRYARDFGGVFGSKALEAMADQTRANMALFEQALGLFTPFRPAAPAEAAAAPAAPPIPPSPELDALKAQLAAMQAQIDKLGSTAK